MVVPRDKYSSKKLAGNFNIYHLHYLSWVTNFFSELVKIFNEIMMLWIQP